ncbi:major facilitator superfamily permease [Corynebacterium kutscheri]|uniref:Putative proline/betaine transporter n=1 Tax=Corynebacterium kutscheri TaxID=35755 RepID=A0AB38VUQ5_9CORY|nr:major facilitator superfamily permease [Corynebacterium kutscheri]
MLSSGTVPAAPQIGTLVSAVERPSEISVKSNYSDIDHSALKKAAAGSFLGNFVEWFDYASYSYLATIIAAVFFPTDDPALALLQTFAVFAFSFILRPIGAVVWGYLGDRRGRRWALSWSILLMSTATFLIGCIPSFATIGYLAPILLLILRTIQGFSASGEYAGASVFLAEYCSAKHRGIYTSLVPASTATGLLLGSITATGLYSFFTPDSLESWGWRLPFLVAGPLGLVGRYIRIHLEDSPAYVAMTQKASQKVTRKTKNPFRVLYKNHWRTVIIAFGVASLNAVAFYVLLAYMPTYLTETAGFDSGKSNLASSIVLLGYVFFIFIMGHLSDKYGRKIMLFVACGLFIVLTVPLFACLETSSFWTVVGVEMLLVLILTMNDSTLPTFLSESFPTEVRYSGFALSFNMANALLGGTAPFVATWLIGTTGNALAPAWYLVGIALLAMIAMIFAPTPVEFEGSEDLAEKISLLQRKTEA